MFFFFVLLIHVSSLAQWIPSEQERKIICNNLYEVVEVLSADSLEGREAGTEGELKARNFIVRQFESIGIEPYFDGNNYFKEFEFASFNYVVRNSKISINKKDFFYKKNFNILSHYVENIKGKVVFVGNGLYLPDENINDYASFSEDELNAQIFLIDLSFPQEYNFINKNNFYSIIQDAIYAAINKGAKAIMLFHSKECLYGFVSNSYFLTGRANIPIIYIDNELRQAVASNIKHEIVFNIETIGISEIAYNVAGWINNNSETSIVIGGHYDHLGYGSPISRHIGSPEIHPGADDNASGIATMLELARFLKSSEAKKHNFIFVAFSAEEKGIIGSREFVNTQIPESENVIAMLNLDMVGRLDSTSRRINILSTNTSHLWDSLINITCNPLLSLNPSSADARGSDHLSFYMKNIPVLFFITGLHEDYHTPRDRIEYLNIMGMVDILNYVGNLVLHLNNISYLPFSESKDSPSNARSRTGGVTLGVIPDHTYEGNGMRIDKVMPERSAFKAGLETGDIVIGIGDYTVSSIYSYMDALSKFKKEQKTKIIFIRDDITKETIIEF